MLSADEQIYATHYEIRDVIYFQNSKKEVDSIIISSIDTSTHFGGDCFISAAPGRHISIEIKNPLFEFTGTKIPTFIRIDKDPQSDCCFFGIRFKDFVFHAYTNEPILSDFKYVSALKMEVVLLQQQLHPPTHDSSNQVIDSSGIQTLYWSKEFGLSGYREVNGEVWTIINKKIKVTGPSSGQWIPLNLSSTLNNAHS